MGNILSYLRWRGDLSLEERPFGMADNLALALLSYVDFSGIVPAVDEDGDITLREAAVRWEEKGNGVSIGSVPPDFLSLMAVSRRFGGMRLSNYTDEIDNSSQTQFSALHIRMWDGTIYVSFRGTGDEIVGWREDFSMSYRVMPAQRKAAAYLEKTMTDTGAAYLLGGHSKGGNLAVYAAAFCPKEKQEQILKIYSNDGPGLCPDIVSLDRYEDIRHKTVRIIPQFSLVGKLFERDEPDLIVKSSVQGAVAHNGFTWEIEGDSFVSCETCSEECRFFNDIFDEWIESADMEHREAFTQDFFDALEAGGAVKMSELTANGMDGIESILIALIRSENRTKIVIGKFLQSVANRVQKADWKNVLRTKEMAVGFLFFIVGLMVIAKPLLAGKCIGIVLGASVLFLMGKRLVACAVKPDADDIRKKWKLSFCLVAMGIVLTLLNQIDFVTGFTEILLSCGFFWLAWRRAKKAFGAGMSRTGRFAHGAVAALSLLLGILPATAYALDITSYTLTAGTFILLYGIVVIVKQMCKG